MYWWTLDCFYLLALLKNTAVNVDCINIWFPAFSPFGCIPRSEIAESFPGGSDGKASARSARDPGATVHGVDWATSLSLFTCTFIVILCLIFLRNAVLHSDYTISHFYQQCTCVPVSLRSRQHLVFSVLFCCCCCSFDNDHPNRLKWSLTVVLIFISFITGRWSTFRVLTHLCTFFREMCISVPLPIFQLDHLSLNCRSSLY